VNFPTTRAPLARWRRRPDNVEYDLADTACEETIKAGKGVHCATGVESRFSAARELGVDSYLGVPLFASDGRLVIGHLAFVDDAPIDEHLVEHPVVRIFASRTEAELRRKRADDTMLLIGRAVAPLSGDVFFRTLIEQLVRTFGFRQAFISEPTPRRRVHGATGRHRAARTQVRPRRPAVRDHRRGAPFVPTGSRAYPRRVGASA
jgi:GAF domain-containing protein